jgi:hypothetical protein
MMTIIIQLKINKRLTLSIQRSRKRIKRMILKEIAIRMMMLTAMTKKDPKRKEQSVSME